MPITKGKSRSATLLALALLAVVVGAWQVYGTPENSDRIVIPPILAATDDVETSTDSLPDHQPPDDMVSDEQRTAEQDPNDPDLSPAEAVVLRIGSGDVDFFGVMTTNGADDEFDDFEATVGQAPDVIQISIGWELDGFDPSLIERITDRGALPSIAWEPWDYRPDIWLQPKYSLQRILDGDYDDYIDAWAEGLARTDQPVLLRLAHEANGDWYPWSESRNGNSPGDYTAMWRYVHDRFDQAGAENVIWVWSPNINPFGSWPMEGVYPGDDYVDLVGLVGYWGHFGETPTTVGTFESVFGSSIDEIRTLTQKPIFISETAASDEGGFKAEWIDEFLTAIADRRDVVGFIWFEVVKEADWRVDSSPDALASFLEGLSQPAFTR